MSSISRVLRSFTQYVYVKSMYMSRVFWEFLRLRQVGGRPSFKNNLVPSKRSVTNS